MTDRVRMMLADLVDHVPVRVDVERQIAAGRRRVRRRRLLAVSGGAMGAVGVMMAAALFARPASPPVSAGATGDQTTPSVSPSPSVSPGPPVGYTAPASPTGTPGLTVPPRPPADGSMPTIMRSTGMSRELLAQLEAAAPALARLPGGKVYDTEMFYPDAAAHRLRAGIMWTYGTTPNQSQVSVDVTIDPRGLGVEVCDPARSDAPPCTAVRRLSNGTVAYVRNWVNGLDQPRSGPDAGFPTYEVRLVRPDGFDVYVSATTEETYGRNDRAHPIPLTPAQVLTIAASITARP